MWQHFPLWSVFRSFCKWSQVHLLNACISDLLISAGSDALFALVSKLQVSLPSHCWLQQWLDSWYTCSIWEWAPISGGWPVSNYSPFTIRFYWHAGSTHCYWVVYIHLSASSQTKQWLLFVCSLTEAIARAEQRPNSSLATYCIRQRWTQQNVDDKLMFWPNVNSANITLS